MIGIQKQKMVPLKHSQALSWSITLRGFPENLVYDPKKQKN